MSLYQLRDYDGADSEFQKALEYNPVEKLLYQTRVNQTVLYCDKQADFSKPAHKNWNEKGIAILKELLEKDPHNAELHMRLGFADFQEANPGGGFSELDEAVKWATPETVSHYTPDSKNGSLFILKQVQKFYVKVRLFKKTELIQNKIQQLEKKILNTPH